MRAVAVGMATSEGLPRCPVDCGGRLGGEFPGRLTEMQKQVRELNGCDRAAAQPIYTITCPHCDGSRILPNGEECTGCRSGGRLRGQKNIHRCPASHMTDSISDALRHYPHAEGGAFPVEGGLLRQSPSYIQFVGTVSGEVAKVRQEQAEERNMEAKAAAKKARTRTR